MDLRQMPDALTCAECADAITETGYLPAIDRDGTYEPMPDAALCGTCGFNEVGFAGCAPEPDDVDPDGANVLLHVRSAESGFDVVSSKP